jgi:hypothetical protein
VYRVAFVPSRDGGTLNASDSIGYMFVSNWSARYAVCSGVTTFRTPSLRQSFVGAVGKFRLLSTQISILSPTVRSVNDRSSAPPVRKLTTGQVFTVPTGGLSSAAAAASDAAVTVERTSAALGRLFLSRPSLRPWPTSLPTSMMSGPLRS